jgi:hypothetical protein
LRDNQLAQISKDHTWVEEQVEAGILTREQAAAHQNRNLLTRALGTRETVAADLKTMSLKNGDKIILCSDGLYSLVSSAEIRAVAGSLSPSAACRKLVAMANERGGADNITVQLIRVENDRKPILLLLGLISFLLIALISIMAVNYSSTSDSAVYGGAGASEPDKPAIKPRDRKAPRQAIEEEQPEAADKKPEGKNITGKKVGKGEVKSGGQPSRGKGQKKKGTQKPGRGRNEGTFEVGPDVELVPAPTPAEPREEPAHTEKKQAPSKPQPDATSSPATPPGQASPPVPQKPAPPSTPAAEGTQKPPPARPAEDEPPPDPRYRNRPR